MITARIGERREAISDETWHRTCPRLGSKSQCFPVSPFPIASEADCKERADDRSSAKRDIRETGSPLGSGFLPLPDFPVLIQP